MLRMRSYATRHSLATGVGQIDRHHFRETAIEPDPTDPAGPDGLTNDQRAAKWSAVDGWLGQLRFAVVPLYAPRGNRVPRHGGCGVVVRLGERVAILTAGHVFDGFAEAANSEILAATHGAFVPLTGSVVRSRGSEGTDRADAAVIVLDEGLGAARMREFALHWRQVDVPPPPASGADLLLFGYPHRDAERTRGRLVTPRRYFWEAKAGLAADYVDLGFPPHERVVGHIPISQAVDQHGRVIQSLTPSGVSGSGMWVHSANPPRLLAIFTDAPGDRFVATPVVVHALLIRRRFPALFQAFVEGQ